MEGVACEREKETEDRDRDRERQRGLGTGVGRRRMEEVRVGVGARSRLRESSQLLSLYFSLQGGKTMTAMSGTTEVPCVLIQLWRP